MKHRYTVRKIWNIFDSKNARDTLLKAEKAGTIPVSQRQAAGSIQTRVWDVKDLPVIGERYGFLKKFSRPVCIAIFSTKGGVLKTSLGVNISRMAALHNIRTCVVGLDLQGDITSALGFDLGVEEMEDMDAAIEKVNRVAGLGSVFHKKKAVQSILQSTDISTLSLIPETADLVALDREISNKARREYWLKEKIVEPLKEEFDLVVLDCSPNWNQLISNALVACDVLISPLECKINQFRNLEVFTQLVEEYKQELGLEYEHVFVPTKVSSTRKLSSEIRAWYLTNVKGVTNTCVRESVQGEESIASHLSLPEHASTSLAADEMRELLREIWARTERRAQRAVLTKRLRSKAKTKISSNNRRGRGASAVV
jgi:chromosome partitioning protein